MSEVASAVLLRFSDLKSRKSIPFSRVHLARLEAQGNFPRRIRLSENTVAWYENEVDDWLAEKKAARGAA
jgi:prophage regulatory protein